MTNRFGLYVSLLVFLLCGFLGPAHAAKRVALVIGNSAYEHVTHLRNPRNDAEAIAVALERLDFDVVKGIDLTRSAFSRVARRFHEKSEGADVALFFYAGHGLQVDGQNYLAPVDARLEDETGLKLEMVTLRTILEVMEREERINLVFLDACRDNPLTRNLKQGVASRSLRIGRGLAKVEFGLAKVESGIGMMIAFATQPGNVALDGRGKHSPFTKALVKHIETPGLDIAELMRKVRLDVLTSTEKKQVPWDHSSLTGSFMFKPGPRPEAAKAAAIAERLRKAEEERIKLKAERERLAREREDFAKQLEKLEEQAETRMREEKAEQQKQLEERAELEKLAQERDTYLAKLEKLEVEAEKLAAQVQANAEERKVAALSTNSTGTAVSDTASPAMDSGEMAIVLQAELKRVGCDPGVLDGRWGGRSRAALTLFNTYAKLSLSAAEPTLQAIDAVKGKQTRVCPVQTVKPQPARTKTVRRPPASAGQRKSSGRGNGRCASGPCKSTATFPSGKKVIIQTNPQSTATW